MNDDVILKVENLSKQYRLGLIGTGTISHDFNRFLAKIRGKEDPFLKIGESNDRATKGESNYVWALKDINFEVKKGEVLGIIGKNGAGKSTLLKILSKVTGPTTGSIKSKGRIASLLEVGTGFHPEMTGKENIFLNGAILGMTKKEIESKFDEIVEFSGCQRYIDTPVKRYSSGMKVRLAFAVAAFLEPDILVVDEVLAVGDAEFQKKAIGKMQDISNTDGRTVLFVSHDMSAVQSLCSKVIVLNNGEVFFEGSVQEGVNNYLNSSKSYEKKRLKDFLNRYGNKTALFQNVELSYSKGNIQVSNTDEVPSGVDLVIDLELFSETVKNDIKIALTILDDNENYISVISNEFTNDKISFTKNKNILTFKVFNFNLRAGQYFFNFFGEDISGCFDKVEKGFEFNVIESDFFGTGKYPKRKKHGIVLLKNKIEIIK